MISEGTGTFPSTFSAAVIGVPAAIVPTIGRKVTLCLGAVEPVRPMTVIERDVFARLM